MCKSYEFEKLANERQCDLARTLHHDTLVREAERGRPHHSHTMLRLTLRYARYALSTLATVGFGIGFN